MCRLLCAIAVTVTSPQLFKIRKVPSKPTPHILLSRYQSWVFFLIDCSYFNVLIYLIAILSEVHVPGNPRLRNQAFQ